MLRRSRTEVYPCDLAAARLRRQSDGRLLIAGNGDRMRTDISPLTPGGPLINRETNRASRRGAPKGLRTDSRADTSLACSSGGAPSCWESAAEYPEKNPQNCTYYTYYIHCHVGLRLYFLELIARHFVRSDTFARQFATLLVVPNCVILLFGWMDGWNIHYHAYEN